MTERLHKIQDLGKILSFKVGKFEIGSKYREHSWLLMKFDKQNR